MTERKSRSLSAKLLLAILLSLLGGVAVYLGVFGLGRLFVDRYYMSPQSVAMRHADIYTEFWSYVSYYQLSGRDGEAVSRFSEGREFLTLSVYSPSELGLSQGASSLSRSVPASNQNGSGDRLYPMRFSDGIFYLSISDNSRQREDTLNRILAMILGILVMISMLLWYTRRLTRRIIRLSQEASGIGAGDLEAPITVTGGDEIAALAENIDRMRASIIEQIGSEKLAWEANSELITAMSHDIRTPMTSLLGYLGLLNHADASVSDEEKDHYLRAAYGKAMDLKILTDELFKYFLVFGHSETELKLEEFDAQLLLMQLLGEAEFDLGDAGFRVLNSNLLPEGLFVRADAGMLKRVLDNLVSNVKKYADREQPVVLLAEATHEEITVSVSNAIKIGGSGIESTKIGLRTCEKIMSLLKGRFESGIEDGRFTASLSLPLYPS